MRLRSIYKSSKKPPLELFEDGWATRGYINSNEVWGDYGAITPDTIISSGYNYCTFIYYSDDISTYGFPSSRINREPKRTPWFTHLDLVIDTIKKDRHFFDEALLKSGNATEDDLQHVHTKYEGKSTEIYNIANDIHDKFSRDPEFIEGRASKDQKVVSFWKKMHGGKLAKCIEWLIKEDIINHDTWIIGENFDPFKPGDNARMREIDPERQAEYDLRRQLHLLPPDQKRAAMKKLGLAWKSNKSPWQKEAERLGFAKPGQKWWAIRSESKHNQ